jgi:hypothetical protein
MARVYVSTVLNAPADAVWRVVRDFNDLPDWTSFVTESRIEGNQPADRIGCVRIFKLSDGATIRERLLGLSDYDLSCTYEILESPMAVTEYVATLALAPVTEGNRTFASWEATFECNRADQSDLVGHIGTNVFLSGFKTLAQRLSSR